MGVDWLDVGWFRTGPIALAIVVWATAQAAPAEPGGAVDETIAFLVNAARDAAGLPPLRVHVDLVRAARTHSVQMATVGRLFHTERDRLESAAPGWTRIAENVGMGPSAEHVHSVFLASPPHEANILGDFSHLGIGSQRGPDGTLFVTLILAHIPSGGAIETDDSAVDAEGRSVSGRLSPAVRRPPPH